MAEPEPIRLDELRARLRETQAAAERLAGQIPPQGWASAQARNETAEEIQALVSILSALRAVVPDDLWEQVREIVRQLLLLLRALLDLVVERLGAVEHGTGETDSRGRSSSGLQDIPIT